MDAFFVFVGRVSLIIGLLYTTIKIWQHFFPDKPNLDVEILAGLYKNPPSFLNEFKEISRKANSIAELYLMQNLFEGILRVEITNKGKHKAESVTLHAEGLQIKEAQKNDNEIIKPKDDLIELGDLNPKGRINLIVWSRFVPHRYSLNDIKITHAKGVAKIKFVTLQDDRLRFINKIIAGIFVVIILLMGLQFYGFIQNVNKYLNDTRDKTESKESILTKVHVEKGAVLT